MSRFDVNNGEFDGLSIEELPTPSNVNTPSTENTPRYD